jgi:perosamine synthetase
MIEKNTNQAELALYGGKPVRPEFLPYGRQFITDEDIEAVCRVLRSDWLTTGPKIEEFENLFAQAVGSKYAIAVSSGTAALHLALIAGNIGPGDEVITSPITFVATANCICYQGATPVFVDVEPDTLNIDPAKIEAAITTKTRAIIAVDYAGQPCDLDPIMALCKKHSLLLIQDSAHALGAHYQGKPVGSLADITAFSLHPVKHITTGEGGMATTNNEELAQRLKKFRNHGLTSDHRQRQKSGAWHYDMEELGYNYRLTELNGTLGISQLEKLPQLVARRREIVAQYESVFEKISEINLPVCRSNCNSSWHLYVPQLNLEQLNANRDLIFQAMRAENIGANVHYAPVPWFTYYKNRGYSKGNWPVAETAFKRIFSLPLWPGMSADDVQDVAAALKKVISAFRK